MTPTVTPNPFLNANSHHISYKIISHTTHPVDHYKKGKWKKNPQNQPMHEYNNFINTSIIHSLFCPAGQRSSFLFLTDGQRSFETFHGNPRFSETFPYDQRTFSISLTCHYHYYWTSSSAFLCSSLAFLYDPCSFYSLQKHLCSSEAARIGPCSFGNWTVVMETSRQLLWTSSDAWCTPERAPNHSGCLLWATRVHTSLYTVPRVAYHGNNLQLHLKYPTYWYKRCGG